MANLWRALLVGGCVALLAPWEGWLSQASTGPATIRITTRQVQLTMVDTGAKGRSPGDVEVSNHLVFNRRVTPRPIGHAEFICTITVDVSRMCRGTIFLPRGKVVVGGSFRFRQLYDLAVLGGTGLYDNARGTLTVTRRSRSPLTNLFFFRLVG